MLNIVYLFLQQKDESIKLNDKTVSKSEVVKWI